MTNSIQETAEWIFGIAKKLNIERKKGEKQPAYSNHSIIDVNPSAPEDYCTVVKKQKKANITPENMGEIILCQVPMVSSTSAIAIMAEYKTLVNLINVLSSNPHALDTMKVNNRKLSKTIIANIYSYLSIPSLSTPTTPVTTTTTIKNKKTTTKKSDTTDKVKATKEKKPAKRQPRSIPISVCLIDTNLL